MERTINHMKFVKSVEINASPGIVFDFLARKHEHTRPAGSPVVRLEKTTPGPVGPGTCFVEDVRMVPGVVGSIRSEVTLYEPGHALGERFAGAGLVGEMLYRFEKTPKGTLLTHEQTMRFIGRYTILNAVLLPFFTIAMRRRLRGIKAVLGARRAASGAATP